MANDPVIAIPAEIGGIPWPQSPALVPNTGQALAIAGGQMQLSDQADYLARFPRVLAGATATIAGAVANGDQLRLTITPPGSLVGVAVNITAATGDTVSNLVEKFIDQIEATPALADVGIYGTGLLGVLTLNAPGPSGNLVAWTRTIVSGSETITLSAATLSGGSGPVLIGQGFSICWRGLNMSFKANQLRVLAPDLVAALVAGGYPVY
jgi:hypothetical protein